MRGVQWNVNPNNAISQELPLYLSLHLKTKEQEAFYYAKYCREQKIEKLIWFFDLGKFIG